jgi:hypothetical protein
MSISAKISMAIKVAWLFELSSDKSRKWLAEIQIKLLSGNQWRKSCILGGAITGAWLTVKYI